MSKVVLKIPQEFEQDFNTDKFKECFERVLADCKAWDYAGLSGRYEHETLEMLLDAFNEAVVLPNGYGRLIDADKFLKDNEAYTGWVLNSSDGGGENAYKDALEDLVNEAPTIIEADKN